MAEIGDPTHARPIAVRLALALGLPMLGVLILGTIAIVDASQRVTMLRQGTRMIDYAIGAGDLVHELQKERGMSATFLASGGSHMVTELPAQRTRSIASAARLREASAGLAAAGLPPAVVNVAEVNDAATEVSGQASRLTDAVHRFVRSVRAV